MKKAFNPNDFFETITVKDVVEKFPQLKEFDYTQESLNEKLVEVNHEITSPDYTDKKYKDIEEYYDLEVDKIV